VVTAMELPRESGSIYDADSHQSVGLRPVATVPLCSSGNFAMKWRTLIENYE
jgi:hypothetical protein